MNKKLLIVVGVLFLGIMAGTDVSADHAGGVDFATVSFADLGVSEPRVLPSNPLYVFKSVGRFMQRMFTFDPVKKAEFELSVADTTLAEAKKTAESESQNAAALDRAIQNYRDAHERLRQRLEALKDVSNNPNLAALLEKLADRVQKHEMLFSELQEKVSGDEAKKLANELKEQLKDFSGQYGKSPAQMLKPETPAGEKSRMPASPVKPSPAASVAPKKVSTSISGFAFVDPEIRISVGSTVTWTNKDSVKHNVMSDDGSGTLQGPLLGTGESFSYTFSKPGTYTYLCTPHPKMKGKVIVE